MSETSPSFSDSLEAAHLDCKRVQNALVFNIKNVNEFWFVLPDGVLPSAPVVDHWLPYLRQAPEGRRACLLTRMAFNHNGGIFTDSMTGVRIKVEFTPCLLISRGNDGRQQVKGLPDDWLSAFDPVVPTEPEGSLVPDLSTLLSGLEETRQTLETIETLLVDPSALLTDDEERRLSIQASVIATKDRALIGLEKLGEVLSHGATQPVDEWRECVQQALSDTIDAMVSFEHLADDLQENKKRELELLHRSIVTYFSHIDPSLNGEACEQFSKGINQIILKDRRQVHQDVHQQIEKKLESDYGHAITLIQNFLSKGASMPLIPFPTLESGAGCQARIVINMVHVAMAVRHCGLAIRLDAAKCKRVQDEFRGWDIVKPPRLFIVSNSNFEYYHRYLVNESELGPLSVDDLF